MDNEVISALPTTGAPSAPLLREMLIKRVIYTFTSTEDVVTFNALDVDTGALPQGLALSATGAIFWLDPNDTTSDHDGVAVVVTADGYRYRTAGDYDFKSVLSFTVTEQPDDPALGDRYIIPAGAIGNDWSSHQDDLAVFTRNGWKFQIPQIGQWVLDEAVGGFISYTESGWVYGPGARSFDAASIPLSAALGWGAIVPVENQTTPAPPIATKGLRYVVGSAATGAWLGKDKQIAICEVTGIWTFYSPENGWQIFDKSTSSPYTWNGASWLSTAGTWIDRKIVQTASGSTTAPSGTTAYVYSTSSGPTTAHRRMIDGAGVSFAAKKAGAKLRVKYSADIVSTLSADNGGTSNADSVIAVFRDSESAAISWRRILLVSSPDSIDKTFYIEAPDTSSHTYSIAITSRRYVSNGSFDNVSTLTLRSLEIEEAA